MSPDQEKQRAADTRKIAGPLEHFKETLLAALDEHTPYHKASREPLVVGIYGEWGSGKSTLLHMVHKALEARTRRLLRIDASSDEAQGKTVTSATPNRLTIPVWFNPWRFEREQHLIVPLLKTAQATLLVWQKQQSAASRANFGWLGGKAKELEEAALALAAGMKWEFSFPGIKLAWDVDKTLTRGLRRPPEDAPVAKYEMIYYELRTHLEALTESRSEGEPPLNLVFMIDDLDRCLPDKAIEMLEAIKLFLDVRGCAFLLAVDDEVIERGILHRYRDYLFHTPLGSGDGAASPDAARSTSASYSVRPPITGAEYLEKIVHLPLRLPLLAEADVQEFLIGNYPQLFASDEVRESPEARSAQTAGEADKVVVLRGGQIGRQRGGAEETQKRTRDNQDLLKLFVNAVPPVPRKLIRTTELLELLLDVAARTGFRKCDPVTLARLVILQLLDPPLYRFGRRNPGFLAAMEQWNEELNGFDPVALGEKIKAMEDAEPRRILEGLLNELLRAREGRSGFDPWNLLDPERRSESPLLPYLQLVEETAKTRALRAEPWGLLPETGRPADRRGFVEQLAIFDRSIVQNALDQEASRLAGQALDRETFDRLLGAVKEKIEKNPESLTVHWLEQIAGVLSRRQMAELYKATNFLELLADRVRQWDREHGEGEENGRRSAAGV